MFTPDEKLQLQAFCKVCDDINSCRFIRDFSKQSHHIFVGTLPDGTVKDEWPRYDDDDFRAMLTHYRKVRLNDGTSLNRIMNLVKRECDDADRASLDHYKNEIKEEGRGWWGPSLVDESGQQILFTQDEVERLILYGEVFHSDPEKSETLKRLVGNGSLMKAVAFWNCMRFLKTVIHYASKMAELIRERGYLD